MNKEEVKEFESLIDIDKTRLDDECERQPYLMWEYGRRLANATFIADEARAEIKVIEAEVDIVVRDSPEDFELDPNKKPTEEAVKKAIFRSKEYKEAAKKYNKAMHKVNMYEAAVKAVDHRRTSISLLDGQNARGYFATPQQKVKTDTGKSPVRRPLKKKRKKRKD